MPSQYGTTCYATVQDASNAFLQNLQNGSGSASTYMRYFTFNSFSGNTSTFEMWTKVDNTVTNTGASRGVFTYTFPDCTNLGPIMNLSGVGVADALTVSWLVVIVWAVAFYFKQMRVGVRGY